MVVNTFFISNEAFLQPNSSLSSFSTNLNLYCFLLKPNSFAFAGFYMLFILIMLPFCILILYHGLQQWLQSSPSTAAMSHSDCFTYHLVSMELIGVAAAITSCCAIHWNVKDLIYVGGFLWCFSWYGETFFHILTCLVRYLVVVHPIIYQSSRNEKEIKIRNVAIFFVWLLCAAATCSMFVNIIILNLIILVISVMIVSFCSLSVLYVLTRPGPGAKQGFRKRVDQKKQRAFYTIEAILGVLVMRFLGSVVWFVALVTEFSHTCLIMAFVVWLSLPSSLVLPLLFFHKNGKLFCWKNFRLAPDLKS